MENERLISWEPFEEKPFDRFDKPMCLTNLQFDGELFILTFSSDGSKEYTFTYKRTETHFYPIRTFRVLEEVTRGDIEELIHNAFLEREKEGLPRATYNTTFYKVENSTYLSWNQELDPSLPRPQNCTLEHHLYITSDYFIDVLSEIQPVITISKINNSDNSSI